MLNSGDRLPSALGRSPPNPPNPKPTLAHLTSGPNARQRNRELSGSAPAHQRQARSANLHTKVRLNKARCVNTVQGTEKQTRCRRPTGNAHHRCVKPQYAPEVDGFAGGKAGQQHGDDALHEGEHGGGSRSLGLKLWHGGIFFRAERICSLPQAAEGLVVIAQQQTGSCRWGLGRATACKAGCSGRGGARGPTTHQNHPRGDSRGGGHREGKMRGERHVRGARKVRANDKGISLRLQLCSCRHRRRRQRGRRRRWKLAASSRAVMLAGRPWVAPVVQHGWGIVHETAGTARVAAN